MMQNNALPGEARPWLPPEASWTMGEGTPGWSRTRYLCSRIPLIKQLLWLYKFGGALGSLAQNFAYDFSRVIRYSSAVAAGNSRGKLAALITMAYHGVEKGLALPAPRPGFGREQINVLLSRLERFGSTFGFDENAIVAVNTLKRYCDFNQKNGIVDEKLLARITALSRYVPAETAPVGAGGVVSVRKEEFLAKAKIDLSAFFNSRSSVRQYSREPVELADIEKAVAMARKTPSCCNRQAGRVWLIQDPKKVEKALDIQGGARGFKQEIPAVMVVAADLACFQSDGERYQAWIDGGMFAMSLIYALHSLGLVTCCLNWSKDFRTDKLFKKEFGVPPNHNIIMLISVGHPKDAFVVAESHRRSVDEILGIL